MTAFSLDRKTFADLKSNFHKQLPQIKSSHLAEALAFALGFNTHAALRSSIMRSGKNALIKTLDNRLFVKRLHDLGYAIESNIDLKLVMDASALEPVSEKLLEAFNETPIEMLRRGLHERFMDTVSWRQASLSSPPSETDKLLLDNALAEAFGYETYDLLRNAVILSFVHGTKRHLIDLHEINMLLLYQLLYPGDGTKERMGILRNIENMIAEIIKIKKLPRIKECFANRLSALEKFYGSGVNINAHGPGKVFVTHDIHGWIGPFETIDQASVAACVKWNI